MGPRGHDLATGRYVFIESGTSHPERCYWLGATHHCPKVDAQKRPEHSKIRKYRQRAGYTQCVLLRTLCILACSLVHRCLTQLNFLQLTESSLCNPVSYFILFYFSPSAWRWVGRLGRWKMKKRLRCDRHVKGKKKNEEREKEGERSKEQKWEWAEVKYSGVHTDLGQTAFTETFQSLPWLSEMPHLEILPLRGKHLKAISAYVSVTDYLTWFDLTV